MLQQLHAAALNAATLVYTYGKITPLIWQIKLRSTNVVQNHGAWIGRLISVGKGAPLLQPGVCIEPEGPMLPELYDTFVVNPQNLFSYDLWKTGNLRMLPADIHLKPK